MSNPTWTRERPTVAGWYWWRAESFYVGVRCVEIVRDFFTNKLRVSGDDAFLKGLEFDDIPGEWLGPITPDSYQQGRVAGLAKAVEIIKANTDVKKAIEIIRLHSLAQQVQEEKGVGDGKV